MVSFWKHIENNGSERRKCKKPNRLRLGFSVFWLPDLDSNQGPAD